MKEKWKAGVGASVVSNTPNKHSEHPFNEQYYGGHLIAESIPSPAHQDLIAAAPEMLRALKSILRITGGHARAKNGTPVSVKRLIEKTIARAEGKLQ